LTSLKSASTDLPGVSQLLRLSATDSTQAVARFLAEQGAPDRTLVWADVQTAGRGRLQRTWTSRPGGLYFSLVLRPSFAPTRLAELSLATAAAAAESLATAGIAASVKPPNGVIGSRGRRSGKVCGILAEASGGAQSVDWVALGVGINVNNAVPGIKGAASLKSLTGRRWDPEDVLRRFLSSFARAYRAFQ
jgi:BirA family biotin operon repressor/biotin-[acetyl-CoA-carboxylase] ligase